MDEDYGPLCQECDNECTPDNPPTIVAGRVLCYMCAWEDDEDDEWDDSPH